jgi:hypothetical protein
MIANALIILTGLWLSYRAIFSISAGQISPTEMMVAGIAVTLLALWARRTDSMTWYSGTCIALGMIVVALSIARHTIGVEALVSFWMVLLIGIAVSPSSRCGRRCTDLVRSGRRILN